jgi:NAD(P)H-dependent flavin oxidoreductase YrpB (nitropropane dioxygenase family)
LSRLLERIGVELPLVQAGMGGGLATHELATAVSDAGGLGTLGILQPAAALERELQAARSLTGRPVALNVLLPFARRRHWRVAAGADAVVTFWGRPRRRTSGVWMHQCGSVDEALAARAAGADGVIAQGIEAGGHVRGTLPAHELLARIRAALPPEYPVLLAGGIAARDDVRAALDAGADAAVLGTRFLMSIESAAHPAYKERLLDARETVLTELFGVGWPAPHRVVWNDAAERWLRGGDPRGPGWLRALNRATAPLASRTPAGIQARLAAVQRAGSPLLSPQPPAKGGPPTLVDSGPLYAGETVARIDDIRPAAELVRDLAP